VNSVKKTKNLATKRGRHVFGEQSLAADNQMMKLMLFRTSDGIVPQQWWKRDLQLYSSKTSNGGLVLSDQQDEEDDS
jgi:hypothetical protein